MLSLYRDYSGWVHCQKERCLDWLPSNDGTTGSEDYGFNDFFESIDTLIMGRNTYELVLTFKEWPYRGKEVIVLSKGFPKTRKSLIYGAEGTSSSPGELVRQLAATGSKHVYVDGGKTVQSFLRAGLIHEMTITRIPILIGAGIPLFGYMDHDVKFEHIITHYFENSMVQSKYRVINPV
ncbi:MAG TPA: dihydrofolate reductase family protein [Candidatus Bathyarchaeia archaeon]